MPRVAEFWLLALILGPASSTGGERTEERSCEWEVEEKSPTEWMIDDISSLYYHM